MTVKEIVEKIGRWNISIDGDKLSISSPSAWVKKNADLIRANKAEIIAYVEASRAEDRKRSEEAAAKARAEQEAADRPLIEAMEAEAARLRGLIPADHVPVEVKEAGNADGWKLYDYIADGVKVNGSDVVVHGWAYAIRPDATEPFAEVCVASISRLRLEEIKAECDAEEARKSETKKAAEEKRAAIFAEAKATGKPQVLSSYMADCNDPHEECSTDIVTTYAMPDGTTKSERQHTW